MKEYHNNPNDNFCPKCHYNYNSHNHKVNCDKPIGSLPIGDGVFILLFLLAFYIIYKKKFKKIKS